MAADVPRARISLRRVRRGSTGRTAEGSRFRTEHRVMSRRGGRVGSEPGFSSFLNPNRLWLFLRQLIDQATLGIISMRAFLAVLLLFVLHHQALADFEAAEAAQRRGEYSEAYEACKIEADAGDPQCQNLVGYLFQEGLGVPANATEAIRLFQLAAKRGLAMAQCYLGLAYERGLGVSPDEVQAVRWYQLAAAQGDPVGEYFFAMSLAAGRGIAQDRARAVELLRHAADRGFAAAQVALGFELERARRPLPAYMWYRIAARMTNNKKLQDRAIQGQNRLLIEFSSQQIIFARSTADNWSPNRPSPGVRPTGSAPGAFAC